MVISRSCLSLLLLQSAMLYVSVFSIAADVSLRVGDLAIINTAVAMGCMSGITMDKSKWLQLGTSSAHPEALLRFMVLGAPSEGVLPSLSWGHREQEELKKLGGLLATRDASIAESTFHQEVEGMGSLHISAWMLGFVCVGSLSPCPALAPAALVNRTDQASGTACLEFTTVWDKLLPGSNTTLVCNTLTAKLINASKQKNIIKQGEGSLDMFGLNVLRETDMEACPSTSMQVAVRSTLDATYNLGPYACYHMNPAFARIAGSEYLLVLGLPNSSNTPGAFDVEGDRADIKKNYRRERPDTKGSLQQPNIALSNLNDCIKWWLQSVQNVELGKCQRSPRLILLTETEDGLDNQNGFAATCRINRNGSFSACLQHGLLDSIDDYAHCNSTMFSFFNSSLIPDKEHEENWWNESGIHYIRGSSSYGLPTDNLCEAGGSFLNSVLTPSTAADNNDHECTYINNPLAVDVEALGLSFTELNNKYAQAHSDAFQLANGFPVNLPTTVIAFAGAAISVLTATVPFTNLLLHVVVRLRGTLGGSAWARYSIMGLILIINIILALVCFSAVAATIVSEVQRSEKFKTWAVIADTMVVNPMGFQLQVLYVVCAESLYKSRLLIFIYSLLATLVVLVGGFTLQRHFDVLKKLKLIETKEDIDGSTENADISHAQKEKIKSYKAIYMNDLDYKMLYHHVHQPQRATTNDEVLIVLQRDSVSQNVVDANDLHVGPDANSTIQRTSAKFNQVALVALSVEKFKHSKSA